ncbi:MAG: N-acetyltransferase [Clostridia bacterium]|nr:N-acetyltransferase [Clostridia bacterium]
MDFIIENNKIYKKDGSGRLIAEITYEDLGNNMYNIDHTFVDESLRGQGIAQMLVEEALKEINKKGGKVCATCSYAKQYLKKKYNI